MKISRRPFSVVALVLFVVAFPAAASDIVIDDFSVAQSLTYTGEPAGVDDHNADDAGIFRGERNLRLEGPVGVGGSATITVSGGAMTWHRPAEWQSIFTVFWDGDNDNTTFDPDFGSGVDLTASGTLNTLRVDTVSSTNAGFEIRIDVYSSAANKSTAYFRVPTAGGNADMRMDQFMITGGTGADFTSVRAISMTQQGYSATTFDAVFDSITVVATPVTERQVGPTDFLIASAGDVLTASVRETAMASNGGTEALVVWNQESVIGSELQREVWARRIDTASGGTIGSVLRVSNMAGDTGGIYEVAEPEVAYNATANEYLVVWRGNDDVIGQGKWEIFGRRIDASTGAFNSSEFRISFMGDEGDLSSYSDYPSVAWDSVHNRYLVAWRGTNSTTAQELEEEIYARVLNADGTSFSLDDVCLSSIGPDLDLDREASEPAVVFDPTFDNGTGRFLVVFSGDHDANGASDIFGQFVNPDGTESGSDFRISDMGDDPGSEDYFAYYPNVAFNPTDGEFLVVWHGEDNTPGNGLTEVFGQRLQAATGAEVGTNDFQISDAGPADSVDFSASGPDVAWNDATDSYVVAYFGNDVVLDSSDIMIQRLTAAGTKLGQANFRVSEAGGRTPAVVFPDRIAIAWCSTAAPNDAAIVGQLVELVIPSGATTTISAAPTSITADGSSTSTITVQAKLANGDDITSGGATVALQSSIGSVGAVTDAGNGTYTAVLTSSTTLGTATITGTIDGDPITDDATVAFVAGPATSFLVEAPANATGGTAFNVTVTARDSALHTAIDYTGTVHFTSTATSATLPADYTFTGPDAGVHTFSVTLSSAGNITLTATDTVTQSITGNDVIAVKGNTTTALDSSKNPSIVGESITFTATVTSTTTGTVDGTVTFKDGAATLGSGPISGGTATFSTSALTQGSHTITAEYGGSTSFHASTSTGVSQTVNLSPFGPPAIVTATATSTSTATVSWTPVSGATGYSVYRSPSTLSVYSLVGTAAGTTLNDSGLSANTTYLYKVAADGVGGPSAQSAADAATTIVFTDSGTLTGVAVKTAHLTELRTAVNAMRAAAGLSAFTFTGSSTLISGIHVTELRQALDAARTQIGLATLTYTDPTITAGTTKVKAAHWSELRLGTQ